MRSPLILILNSIIICNILVSASTLSNEIGEVDSEADKEDNNTNKFINTQFSSPRPSVTTKLPKEKLKICRGGIHIRNDLKSFEQLENCRVVDGPLTIALVSNQKNRPYEAKDYENLTFPLEEVTGYLLLFRVEGLSTLSGLFPKLAVIRGEELVSNYALIIYEMMHLQRINLPSLTDILRGSVRIESNPNLCFASTVNWDGICKIIYTPHFLKDNNVRCNDRCPDTCLPWNLNSERPKLQGDVESLGSKDNRSLFCWSNQICHEACQNSEGIALPRSPNGGCCSSKCAGGCYESNRSDKCISCRYVLQGAECVEQCDNSLYEYNGECITDKRCILQSDKSIQQNQCSNDSDTSSSLKPIRLPGEKHGRCQVSCPPGFEDDPDNKYKCKPCDKGKCRKVCTPPQGSTKSFMVTNVNSLRDIAGCNVINGSLEISMKGGKNVLHELETALQDLEEIKGYLKITRSYSILTLGFLNRLKAINGSELERDQYSLIILDNTNLQELFMFNKSDSNQKQLNILQGRIFVHLNPKLCPSRINNLKSYASVADWDETDVSPHTNGDKEACDTERLEVEFVSSTARATMIRFPNFALKMDDPRALLYYLISYRKVPYGKVTMFEGRDGCNSQNDVWTTIEESPISKSIQSNQTSYRGDEYQEVMLTTEPATRYVVYVKTFTILTGSKGAISDMIYFVTGPDTPGIPKQIEGSARDHDSVVVSWSPPSRPNGIIEYYIVTITQTPELDDIQSVNICDSLNYWDKIPITSPKKEPSAPIPQSSATGMSENAYLETGTCSRPTFNTDVDIHTEVVTFQDLIIDIVYLRQPCIPISNSTKNFRRKRSVEYEHLTPKQTSPSTGLREGDNLYPLNTSTQSIPQSKILQPALNHNDLQYIIEFDRIKGIKTFTVTVNQTRQEERFNYTIKNLRHYTSYSFEVKACHGNHVGYKTITSKDYKKCSLQAITQVRTQPIEEYDIVSRETISFSPANETSVENIITWRKPEQPNGLILAYRFRYRPKDSNSEIWTEGCINNATFERTGGITLSNISPGLYVVSVQAVSLYSGQRFWSQEVEFEIPQIGKLSATILTTIIAFSLVVIALGVASGTYYYQKKLHGFNNGLIYASVNPDYIQYDPDEWEVDKSNLIIGSQIGTGAFGMVYKGQLNTEKGAFSCAVKTVPPTSTTKQRMDFLREASIMKEFDTYHVVRLMGVISTTTPVYVIMEFMENGDLKGFLRRARDEHIKENKSIADGVYLMAAQIADGMAYLASKKFVHRDLAARNCMVGEDKVVKIGDFGLTRDIYANDYYRRDTGGRLPVRWMAPESLKDNLYTSASDAFSYGIVVWELVTFSEHPYQGLSNEEVIERVKQGFTMPRPQNCPDKLHTIMEQCWRRNYRDRPTFMELVERLLPETEGKLYPNCFYRKKKTDGDSIAQPVTEENNTGAESYPLLSWPPNCTNGLTNGVNHVQTDIK